MRYINPSSIRPAWILEKSKRNMGDQLVVWGGIMVEHLVSGTPEDIRRDAEYAMRVAAPGGGFIFGETHSIAVGTNYDNFMALLDAYHNLAYKAAQWF